LNHFKLRIECYGLVGKDKQSSTATLGFSRHQQYLAEADECRLPLVKHYGW
jgi:hypothetical protein